jgi:DNA-binding transcriptional regulator YdaS (Cro superfamily)
MSCMVCKTPAMQTFPDFCVWMKSQRRVALALGLSEPTVSRWRRNPRLVTRDAADRIEEISHGVFTARGVMFPDESRAA